MSRQLPQSTRLDGLDVSHDQCPPAELLPSNVKLRVHDCLAEPPTDLLKKYDIIHIQNFITLVKENDPEPLLRNVLKMLSEVALLMAHVAYTDNTRSNSEPGGYLSWGEYDYQTWQTKSLPSTLHYNNDLNKMFEYTSSLGDTTKRPNHQQSESVFNCCIFFEDF